MQYTLYPYQLKFRYPFHISHGLRTHTDVVFIKIEHEGFVGWGEATLPPYLRETRQSVIDFLSLPEVKNITLPVHPPDIFKMLDEKFPGNMSAKAALDMALWNLKSQMEQKSIGELLEIQSDKSPLCTYTIGLCSFDEMKRKVEEANAIGFKLFKIKLDGKQDEEMISDFRKLTNKPFAVDVNQGWKDVKEALTKIKWLSAEGCMLIEQPLVKDALEEMKEVKSDSLLPVFADESCQQLSDLEKVKESFHGVNIKLMKCGGVSQAVEMILQAKKYELKVLVGCMSESSVGCSAAANLAPLADYVDLDGPYLIANDPFEGMKVEEGKVKLSPLVQKHPLS
ncbi:MAG: dipeptide epimerase [Bacteroidetes bacterium]|nr:dipeptide epimerase [Bacteroidota bacterium]